MPYRETQRDASGAPSTDGNIKPNPNFDKVVSLYGPSALLRDESRSPYGDASGDTVLPTYLKASASIDKFLWLRKLLVLALVFTMSFSFVIFLFMSLPRVPESDAVQGESKEDVHRVVWERAAVGASSWGLSLPYKLPKNIGELQTFRAALIIYKKEHQRQVQIGIICLYLFLQAFMIPGTIFLNILAGSLYGFYQALFLVLFVEGARQHHGPSFPVTAEKVINIRDAVSLNCYKLLGTDGVLGLVLATVGSALCYTLSYFILKEIVYYYFPERCKWLAREVHRHHHNLFNYILFLRITPILPNWFINVTSPLVAVPFWCFSGGTFIGLIPASMVAVKAGGILSEINSLTDLYDLKTIITISIIAVLVLVPVALKHRFDQSSKPDSNQNCLELFVLVIYMRQSAAF